MMLSRLKTSLAARPGKRIEGGERTKQAAVAVVIRPNLDVLFIRRAVHEGDPWSGHMALPGGRRDPTDPSLDAVARRETREEVGVDLRGARGLGRIDDLASPGRTPGMVVSPFVYALDADPEVTIEPTEVAAHYWFGLQRLVDGEGRSAFRYVHDGRPLSLPCIDLDGQRIWGITLGIVDDLVGRLTSDPR